MDEVFLFEEKFDDDDGHHTVTVSGNLRNNMPIVYNCIVDIHTNIQIIKKDDEWVQKDYGPTNFSLLVGKMIDKFLK